MNDNFDGLVLVVNTSRFLDLKGLSPSIGRVGQGQGKTGIESAVNIFNLIFDMKGAT